MIKKNDWRLEANKSFLENEVFRYLNFAKEYEDTEHDHCIFCKYKTFSSNKEHLQWGYASTTRNGYWWVCPECFEDFKEIKGWTTITDNKDN